MSDEQKKPVIVAFITSIECPICEVEQIGFVNDPRGGNFTCNDCGKPFHVPVDATVDFG
ncbi:MULTISPECIES: hypothetical protein [Pseudomonas syringae group]|uniref:hypothetical protein n=1 Tax=Pseudomonas syringae group TaxID=136849 RepID=UPI001604D835|nr:MULTISPECIES: hypothetical protein [Pseudomonas syringae group]MDH4602295.1 hypothetical protein [Pseudomonas syringae pv. papulans]